MVRIKWGFHIPDCKEAWIKLGRVRTSPSRRGKLLEKVRKGLGFHLQEENKLTFTRAKELTFMCVWGARACVWGVKVYLFLHISPLRGSNFWYYRLFLGFECVSWFLSASSGGESVVFIHYFFRARIPYIEGENWRTSSNMSLFPPSRLIKWSWY